MAKSVKFARPNKPATTTPEVADKWVEDRTATEPKKPAEPMKRFTIDVPASLHTRVKAGCAVRGVKMADVIRAYLELEFPES